MLYDVRYFFFFVQDLWLSALIFALVMTHLIVGSVVQQPTLATRISSTLYKVWLVFTSRRKDMNRNKPHKTAHANWSAKEAWEQSTERIIESPFLYDFFADHLGLVRKALYAGLARFYALSVYRSVGNWSGQNWNERCEFAKNCLLLTLQDFFMGNRLKFDLSVYDTWWIRLTGAEI